MQRLRLLTFASLAMLSSCAPPDSALRVNVTVRAVGTARVRADCLRLTISNETQELKSLTIRRPTDDDAVFAVRKGNDLPGTVRVQASGFIGSNCGDETTLKLNAQGEVVTGVFPESGVTELAVFLDPPNAALDSDRDGFVADGKGGLDCNDADRTIFPGAGQVCANTVDTDCDGQRGCDDAECGSAAACLDPPDRVRVTTTITSMLRYECRGPFRVELHNGAGVRRAIRDTAVALSASLPGVSVHTTGTCTDTAVTSLPILYDSTFFEVWLKADGQAFGITTLTATAAQVATPGSVMVKVDPQPIDHLEFTSMPRTVSAGQCSIESLTLEFRDVMNRRTDVDSPTTLTLSSAPGDINANIFFTDPLCAVDGSMQRLVAGEGSITLHVMAGRAGTFTLTATPSAGTGTTQMLTVQPSTAKKLAFTNAPLVLSTTQMCSAGVFTLQLRDQFDNPVTAAADVPVRVAVSGLLNVSLFESASGCAAAPQTDFIIPANSTSILLRARGTTAPPNMGEIRGNVLNGAAITDATQVLRISADFASKFVMTGSARTPQANVCSNNPLTIELLDSANNPASSATPVSFALTTNPASDASFRFFGVGGCSSDLAGTLTVPAGQTSASFFFRGDRAFGPFEIQASTASLTRQGTYLQGNFVLPGPPGRLVFTAPLTQVAQAGTCTPSPYIANVRDLFNNPTSFATPQTVTVTSAPAVGIGVTVGPSACNSGNTVTLAGGATAVSFNAQHTVTTPLTVPYALTASVGGFSTSTPVTLAVTPGPSTLRFETPSGTAPVVAGGCQQMILSRKDSFGNNAPTSGATTVSLALPASTSWVVYSSPDCMGGAGAPITMNTTHTVTFSVSPRTTGTHQVTASIPGGQMTGATFQVSAAAPTLVFELPATDAGTASASQTVGGCTPVQIARKDIYGNDAPLGPGGGTVLFTLPTGTTAHSATPCTTGPGNTLSSIPLTPTDARAGFYVRATVSNPTGGSVVQTVVSTLASQSTNLSLTVSPGAPNLRVALPVGGAATLAATQCQRVNVERRDSFMNLVPAAGPSLTVTPTAANLETFASINCTGTAVANIPVTPGSSTRDFSIRSSLASPTPRALTVTLDGQTAPLTLTITPGPTTEFVVQGLPATMSSEACVGPLTLRRRDASANDTSSGNISVAVSSGQFTFSSAADCSGALNNVSVNIADLSAVSANFYATAAAVGTATLTATLGTATGMGSLSVLAGPGTQLVFTTPSRTFLASACSGLTNVIRVQLRDNFGNPTSAPAGGRAFTATSTSGTASWFTDTACATAAAGGGFTIAAGLNSVNLFYRDLTVGMPSVSLTNGVGLANPPPQDHSVTVGPPTQLTFTTPTRTFIAASCGGAARVITVQLQDSVGNPVNAGVGGQTFTALSNSTGTVTWFTDDTCATVAAGGAFTIPQGMGSVGLYYRDTRAPATPAISLASSLMNPNAQTQTLTVGPPFQLAFTTAPQSLAALACSTIVTVIMQDAGGNTVNAGANRDITFSGAPGAAATRFYPNSSCGTQLPSDRVTMSAASSSVFVHFKADNADSVTLTADTPSIVPATQLATIRTADATRLVFTTTPTTVEAGFCLPVIIERQDSLNRPAIPATAASITLSVLPTPGSLFFTDATCATPLTGNPSIASGMSNTTVHLKGISGGLTATVVPTNQVYALTAASLPLTPTATLNVTVQPMVRRRNAACTLATGSIACPLVPSLTDISRTILFAQATPNNDDTAADDSVSCRLAINGTTLLAEVVCDRSGTAGNVNIEWQTASFPYSFANGGVSVQHLPVSGTLGCTVTATTAAMSATLSPAVTLGQSFVLFSNRSPGNDNDGDAFFTAQLTATNLTFFQSSNAPTCTRTVDFDAQVVSWAGATVNRGLAGTGNTLTYPVTRATVASSPTFLLYSSRMGAGDTGGGNLNNICRRRLRGEIVTGNAQVNFERGCIGADIQEISWEHVRLPLGSVQQVTGATASGTAATGNLTFNPVDLTRAVAFLGGQGQGGSASGMTDYSANDRVGAALARAVFGSATQLSYVRSSNSLVGTFTGYVVEFAP